MSITEADRHEIYEHIRSQLGDRVANNVMSMLPPVGWADIATKADLHALESRLGGRIDGLAGRIDGLAGRIDGLEGRIDGLEGRIDGLEGRIDGLDAKFDAKFDGLDAKFDAKFDRLDAKFDTMGASLRAEMHQSVRNQTWALVGWTTALAGIVVAIGR